MDMVKIFDFSNCLQKGLFYGIEDEISHKKLIT